MKKGHVLLIGALLLACASPIFAESGKNQVVAQVGNEQLTEEKLNARITMLPPQVQEMLKNNPATRGQLINAWVEMILWAKDAESQGLEKTPDIQLKLSDMRHSVLAMAAKEKLAKDMEVSSAERDEYYQQHKQEFIKPEEVSAQHILINLPEKSTPEEETKAQAIVKEVQEKIKKNESFAELAKTYSDDPGSKTNGGNLGPFGRGRMVPEFEKAAFATPVGQVSEPVRTKFGFHLIKVNEKTPESQQTLADATEKIDAIIKGKKQKAALDKHLTELKGKYPVTVSPEVAGQ